MSLNCRAVFGRQKTAPTIWKRDQEEVRCRLSQTNIIFQAPEKAILYQGGVRLGLNEDITDSANLVELLKQFFGYREPHHQEWETAVAEFSDKIPQIAEGIREILQKEKKTNPKFVASFTGFVALSRQAINPNLSEETVENHVDPAPAHREDFPQVLTTSSSPNETSSQLRLRR